jgi:hypothetical protein
MKYNTGLTFIIFLFCVYVLISCFVNHLVVFCPFYFDHYFNCVYSPLVYRGVRVTQSFVLCLVDRRLTFCSFSLFIVFSVRLRYTSSDYPFSIFKLFLENNNEKNGLRFNILLK